MFDENGDKLWLVINSNKHALNGSYYNSFISLVCFDFLNVKNGSSVMTHKVFCIIQGLEDRISRNIT